MSIQYIVTSYLEKRGNNINKLAEEAHVSNTSVIKARKGHFDSPLIKSISDMRHKIGIANTIRNIVRACGYDAGPYLKRLDLDKVRPKTRRFSQTTRGQIESILNIEIFNYDLDYLKVVCGDSEDPMTIGLIVELIRRRKRVQ